MLNCFFNWFRNHLVEKTWVVNLCVLFQDENLIGMSFYLLFLNGILGILEFENTQNRKNLRFVPKC